MSSNLLTRMLACALNFIPHISVLIYLSFLYILKLPQCRSLWNIFLLFVYLNCNWLKSNLEISLKREKWHVRNRRNMFYSPNDQSSYFTSDDDQKPFVTFQPRRNSSGKLMANRFAHVFSNRATSYLRVLS